MQLFRKLEDIPADFGPAVVSVGNFDGVHLGHQKVISHMVSRAKALNARSIVLSFDPHPVRILRPREAPPLITPMSTKLKLLEQTGVDAAAIIPFSRDLSNMAPFEFAETVLFTALHAIEVHEGFNFRFGHRAEGNVERLREFGHKLGFEVVVHSPLTVRGHAVSSSQIRKLISAGNVAVARHLLNRPFAVLGTPGRGRGFGTKYAVPTINLSRYDELMPGNGVYVTHIRVADETFDSVTNVGNRPTFGPDSFAIETHILDFHPLELTPETEIELTFHKQMREERRFASPEALKEQISRDVHHARRFFSLMRRFTRKAGA
jgi:riboflavin kinase / FMN adenylyltransferase